jgi:hypothetical protein
MGLTAVAIGSSGASARGVSAPLVHKGIVVSQHILENPGGVGSSRADHFGTDVAVDGQTLVSGAPLQGVRADADARGVAYVYVQSASSWELQATLVASDGADSDYFGSAVAISGDTILIGAPWADLSGAENAGAVYVFSRTNGNWKQRVKLTADDFAAQDRFGAGLAYDGTTALIGAIYGGATPAENRGAVYALTGSADSWSQQQKLLADDRAPGDGFGIRVALRNDIALIGAPSKDSPGALDAGAAYIFIRTSGVWTQQAKLLASDLAEDDWFGYSVALADNTAVVGTPYDEKNDIIDAGSISVFVMDDTTWEFRTKHHASDEQVRAHFGSDLAIEDDTLLVSASSRDWFNALDVGAVHVLKRRGVNWVEKSVLIGSDLTEHSAFGFSVAIDDHLAFIGAPFRGPHQIGGSDFSAVYVMGLPDDFFEDGFE